MSDYLNHQRLSASICVFIFRILLRAIAGKFQKLRAFALHLER
ncbi:hypothetical protein GXM_02371 [Nostoc sphaeroides CCNUC1]|uniref:Uncharacterized protein n=1 Tax=Nostoc sphaeroides CCNUC1 TaxID=2653204 RepID=A0A5P8VXN9_9NOSO|nr:hypothetical protein GXM_02371 [Nostoc sphaeroides CCNUC1]